MPLTRLLPGSKAAEVAVSSDNVAVFKQNGRVWIGFTEDLYNNVQQSEEGFWEDPSHYPYADKPPQLDEDTFSKFIEGARQRVVEKVLPNVEDVKSEALKQLHAPGLAAGMPATPYTFSNDSQTPEPPCSDADNAVLVLSDSDLEMVKYERTNAGRPYKKITECKPQKSEFVKKPQDLSDDYRSSCDDVASKELFSGDNPAETVKLRHMVVPSGDAAVANDQPSTSIGQNQSSVRFRSTGKTSGPDHPDYLRRLAGCLSDSESDVDSNPITVTDVVDSCGRRTNTRTRSVSPQRSTAVAQPRRKKGLIGRPRQPTVGITFSEAYNKKSSRGQADERYKERLKLFDKNKYRRRVSLSSLRSNASRWRRELSDALKAKIDTQMKLDNIELYDEEERMVWTELYKKDLQRLETKMTSLSQKIEDYEEGKAVRSLEKKRKKERTLLSKKKRKLNLNFETSSKGEDNVMGFSEKENMDEPNVGDEGALDFQNSQDAPKPDEQEEQKQEDEKEETESEHADEEEEKGQQKPRPNLTRDILMKASKEDLAEMIIQINEGAAKVDERLVFLTEQLEIETDNRRIVSQALKAQSYDWATERTHLAKRLAEYKTRNAFQEQYVEEAWSKIENANTQINEMTLDIARLTLNTTEDPTNTQFRELYRNLYAKYISVKGARVSEWRSSKLTIQKLEQKVKQLRADLQLFDEHGKVSKEAYQKQVLELDAERALKQNVIRDRDEWKSLHSADMEHWGKLKSQLDAEIDGLQRQVNRLETTIHGMANASKALAECEQHFKSENAKEKSELLTAYKEKLAEKDRLIAAQDEELKLVQQQFREVESVLETLQSSCLEPDNPNNLERNYFLTKVLERKNFHEAYGPKVTPPPASANKDPCDPLLFDMEVDCLVPEHNETVTDLPPKPTLERGSTEPDTLEDDSSHLEATGLFEANPTGSRDSSSSESSDEEDDEGDATKQKDDALAQIELWQTNFFSNEPFVEGHDTDPEQSADEDEAKEKDPKWQDTSLVHFISDDESNPVKELTTREGNFIRNNQVNLQALAGSCAYEYASRDTTGSLVQPDPQSFEEARAQLIDDKEESEKKEEDTETSERRIRTTYMPEHVLDPTKHLEKLDDQDDRTFEELAKKGVRTKYETQRYLHLYKLKYIKTRVMRSRERRADMVNDNVATASALLGRKKSRIPLPNKLPDFKLRQVRNFYRGDENSTKFNLLTNPTMSEAEFMSKFKKEPGN